MSALVRSFQISPKTSIIEVVCARCGCQFYVHAKLAEDLKAHGREFFCPSGHSIRYRDAPVKRLTEQLRHALQGLRDSIESGSNHYVESCQRGEQIKRLKAQLKKLQPPKKRKR